MKQNMSRLFGFALTLALIISFLPAQAQPAYAVSPNIVISQVYGGGGNSGATYKNDFIELFNIGSSSVSLNGWSVQYASTAGTTWAVTNLTNVSLSPGQYYLVQEAAGTGGTTNLPTPDATGSIAMSANNGKVALVNSTTALTGSCPSGGSIVDFIGFGTANCFETAVAPAPSNTTADIRTLSGCTDTDNNSADFALGAPAPRNTASLANICGVDSAPYVASTVPANGAVEVPLNSNIIINFSEPVNVSGSWVTLSCTTSGAHTATVSGGPTAFTLTPDTVFVESELCTLTVIAANVTDQDLNDPPDNMTFDFTAGFRTVEVCGYPFTPIYDVQGNGAASPLVSTEVAIEGVVVGDFQNNASPDNGDLNGFHVQDPVGDGDPTTSDGVFVYASGGMDVSVGDAVRVRGNVSEYNGMTEITASQIWQCSTGNNVAPTTLSLPVTSVDDFEAYEGMLVTFPQSLYISEYFNFDRYGEIVLTSQRHLTPTAEFEPGPVAIQAAQDFLLDSITLDDGRSTQNPDPAIHPNGNVFDLSNLFRGGDILQNVTGVMDYNFGLYRIQPTQGADYVPANLRPTEPESVGGNLRVVSMNTLNYFSTIDTGAFICGPAQDQECRGADTPEEFARQRAKLIAGISAMNADVVGLLEIENNINDEAIQNLVDGLNVENGAGTYDYIHTGVIGTDAIKVALIYKPASVSFVGNYAILDSSVDSRFIDTKNRPVLAQTFMDNNTGGIFTVAVNHLKSKGSGCNDVGDPDLGDGAGNCNITRTLAAQALVDWLATDPTGSGDSDFLIIGDLNSYDKEDPIDAIKAGPDDILGTADDYTDMVFQFQGEEAYSYVFDGQLGYLDYALASASLVDQISGVTEWHVNADEPDLIDYDMSFKLPAQDALYAPDPYRYSDHDPVIIGLAVFVINDPPTVDAGGPYTVNEGSSITLTATGTDPEGQLMTYAWDLDNNGSFETPGQSVTFTGVDGPATLTVNVQVTDNGGLMALASAIINVNNVAPSYRIYLPLIMHFAPSYRIYLPLIMH